MLKRKDSEAGENKTECKIQEDLNSGEKGKEKFEEIKPISDCAERSEIEDKLANSIKYQYNAFCSRVLAKNIDNKNYSKQLNTNKEVCEVGVQCHEASVTSEEQDNEVLTTGIDKNKDKSTDQLSVENKSIKIENSFAFLDILLATGISKDEFVIDYKLSFTNVENQAINVTPSDDILNQSSDTKQSYECVPLICDINANNNVGKRMPTEHDELSSLHLESEETTNAVSNAIPVEESEKTSADIILAVSGHQNAPVSWRSCCMENTPNCFNEKKSKYSIKVTTTCNRSIVLLTSTIL